MSEFIVYRCSACEYQIPVGFLGNPAQSPVICRACEAHFIAVTAAGHSLFDSDATAELMIMGQESYLKSSKKGRVKSLAQRRAWVRCGQVIPKDAEAVQIGDDLYIHYLLNFDNCPCPNCQQNALRHYHDYVKACARCGQAPLIEETL